MYVLDGRNQKPHAGGPHVLLTEDGTRVLFDREDFRLLHLGPDPAGTDGVHSHAASSPLRREGSCEPYESVLARVVRRPFRAAQ